MHEGEWHFSKGEQEFTADARPEIQTERQQQWDKLGAEVDLIRDGLGKKVDQGIRETVIALKAHELRTIGSCEGHEDWGLPFLWVDMKSPEVARMQKDPKYRALSEKSKAVRKGGEPMSSEEAATYHQMLVAQRIVNDAARQRINLLLTEYYGKGADGEQPTRITFAEKATIRIQPWYGREYDVERHNLLKQSMSQQDVRNVLKTKYLEKLLGGQEEMRKFTAFLKNKFFSSEKPVT